jgi:type IV pilus assembly protein PilC
MSSSAFRYQGRDRLGKRVRGVVEGASPEAVQASLRRKGILAEKVTAQRASKNRGGRIKSSDLALFTRQLATMMRAGVPLVQSFGIVAEGLSNPAMKTLVLALQDQVASGTAFAAALRGHPKTFDALYCNLVDAGEQAGALETMLDRLATYREKSEALRGKIRKALTYPVAVLVIALAVTGLLLIKVVPQFEDVFSGFGAALPPFTQLVITLSEWAQAHYLAVLVGLIGGGFGLRYAHGQSQAFRDGLDRFLLRLPVLGPILERAAVARFARTLATTFGAGVPLVEGLRSAAGATGNAVFRDATLALGDEVTAGTALAEAMNANPRWPSMIRQMVLIGEQAGAVDDMLDKAAAHYEQEVDNAVESLTELLEPVIMSVLGVLVGGLIVAMYLPIFQLGSVVGGGVG